MSHDESSEQYRSVIALIRAIRDGSTAPTSLAPEDRRHCVEHLTAEGYSVVEIGEILATSERTIARDRAALRHENAIERRPDLLPETVGRLVQEADQSIGRIRRAARDRQARPGERVEAEYTAWRIARELTERLQSLGYLPTAATQVSADLIHHHQVDGLPDFAQLQEELDRVERIVLTSADGVSVVQQRAEPGGGARDRGRDEGDGVVGVGGVAGVELRSQLLALRGAVHRGIIAEQVALLSSKSHPPPHAQEPHALEPPEPPEVKSPEAEPPEAEPPEVEPPPSAQKHKAPPSGASGKSQRSGESEKMGGSRPRSRPQRRPSEGRPARNSTSAKKARPS